VTVAVIAHHAGISPGTFYRHFADHDAAFTAALATLAEQCVEELPALDVPVGTRDAERARFDHWFAALHRAVVSGRAFRWFMTVGAHDKLEAAIVQSLRIDPRALLAGYFRRLEAAGVTRIGDADALANGVLRLHAAVARDIVLNGDAEAGTPGRWAEVFPVIERAVFS
jgi:AcrR family transcriptional regulator